MEEQSDEEKTSCYVRMTREDFDILEEMIKEDMKQRLAVKKWKFDNQGKEKEDVELNEDTLIHYTIIKKSQVK